LKEILEMGENDTEEQEEEKQSEPAKPINLAQTNPPKQELIDPSMANLPVFEKLIANNQIMVFSMIGCPHSMRAKELLKSKGLEFKTYEIDENAEHQENAITLANNRKVLE